MSAYMVGFVYVLTNPDMPGLVKVGKTVQLPEDRAKGLHTTGVPRGFDVEFRALTSQPYKVEQRAHNILDPYRRAPNREFFRTSPPVAIEAVRQAELEITGIDAWAAQPIHRLRSGDRVVLALRADELFVEIAYLNLLDDSATIPDLGMWQAHTDGDHLEVFASNDPGHVAGFSDGDPGGDEDPVPFLDRAGTAPNGVLNGRERLVPGVRLVWLGSRGGSTETTSVVFEAEAYCQLVGRTWDLKVSPKGSPLLIGPGPVGALTVDEPSAAQIASVQRALALPRPRKWAPLHPEKADGWATIGTNPQDPAYWLQQLRRKRRPGNGRSTHS